MLCRLASRCSVEATLLAFHKLLARPFLKINLKILHLDLSFNPLGACHRLTTISILESLCDQSVAHDQK